MRRTRQSNRASEDQQSANGRAIPALAPKRRKVIASKKSVPTEATKDKLDEESLTKSSSEELVNVQPPESRKAPSNSDVSDGEPVAVSAIDEDYEATSSEESDYGEGQTESDQCSSDSDFDVDPRKRNVKAKIAAKPSRLSLAGAKMLRTSTKNDAFHLNTSSASTQIVKKVKKSRNPDSSSESSSDEFVRVKPSDSLPVDMQPVLSTTIKTEDPFAAIEKSIFSGVSTLSGSESESEAEYTEVNWPSLPSTSQTNIILIEEHPQTVSKNPSRSKGKGRKGKADPKIDPKTLDVSQLLKLGEGLGSENLDIPKFVPSDDDLTDLEEVSLDESELKDEKPKYVIPKEGVEITLDVPEVNEKRKKKDFDVQAFLLRRLNNRKRSIQVLIHKVHLLGCISHGRYVNSVLNSQDLMGVSLSLIPSQQCYPPKHADLSYLEKFLLWFNKTVSLKDAKCISKYPSNLLQSLLKQFDTRLANSKRDLVFMFISVLRSLGIKARLVVSLQPAPLKLASTELCCTLPKKAVDSLNYYVDKHNSEKKKSKKSKKRREVKPEVPKHSEKKASNLRKKNENKSKYFAEKLKKPIEENEIVIKHESIKEEATSKYFKNDEGSSSKSTAAQRRKRPKDSVVASKQSQVKLIGDSKKKSPVKKGILKKNEESELPSRKSLPRQQAPVKGKHTQPEDSESDVEPVKKQPKKDLPKKQLARKPPIKKTSGKKKNRKVSSDSGSDSDFQPEFNKFQSSSEESEESEESIEPEAYISKKPKKKWSLSDPIDRRVLSSDSSDDPDQPKKGTKKKVKKDVKVIPKKVDKKLGVDIWSEVFLEAEEKWFSVDVPQKKIHCSSELHAKATQPVLYVVGFSPDLSIKDVTRRYVVNWTTIKQRVDEVWWEKTLKAFHGKQTAQDREEDEELSDQMLNHPLPTVIGEYKNHPLYALKRHLLKFEAIYPPETPTLGFVRGEAVYARENVASLHSREVWVKEAKVVRAGEQAYKIVKARPKYNRATGTCITDIPLDLFGAWQVGEYVPPVAEDGKVPRNEYGNVELFKPCMLPKGTVHLPIAGLSRVAKKLGIDCAPAMIGFDFHSGGSHPTFDGYVVCEEFKDTLLDAWTQEVEMAAKRAAEKRDKRVYDNWKRLIKGLLIRERLKDRYSFGEKVEEPVPKPSTSKESSSKPKSSKTVFKKIPASSRAKRKD